MLDFPRSSAAIVARIKQKRSNFGTEGLSMIESFKDSCVFENELRRYFMYQSRYTLMSWLPCLSRMAVSSSVRQCRLSVLSSLGANSQSEKSCVPLRKDLPKDPAGEEASCLSCPMLSRLNIPFLWSRVPKYLCSAGTTRN